MPIENKPYLWLDNINKRLEIRIWSKSYKLKSDVAEQQQDGDTLRLIYKLSKTGTVPLKAFYDFNDPRCEYDPSKHARIVVVLIDDTDKILGHCTVKPAVETFSTINYDQPSDDLIPYLYVQFRDTDTATVHIAAFMSPASVIVEEAPKDDFDIYERKVNYNIKSVDSAADWVEEDHLLDFTTDFDPVLDNIVISLTENNSSGLRKKGTGTIHTSEADASSAG